MTPFRLAVLSLGRRRVPTFIALIAISISVAFSGVLLRLYVLSGARFSSLATGPEAVVGAKAGGIEILLGSLNLEGRYPDFIPYKLYASLKNQNAVQFEDGARSQPSFITHIVPFVYFAKFKDYRVIGTDGTFLTSSMEAGQWFANRGEVVLGATVAARENIKVGQKIAVNPWTSDIADRDRANLMRVVGVLKRADNAWDSGVYASLEDAWETLKSADLADRSIWNEQVLHYFLINLNPDDPRGAYTQLQSLVNRRTVAQGINVKSELAALEDLTGTGRTLGLLVCFMIVGLGALGVAAMMVTRFDAMSTQLAVLRAMGFAKSEIRSWLLWEGALLGVTASFLGSFFDAAIFPLVRHLLGSALPPSHLVSVGILHSSPVWIMACLGTMLAVFIPLYRLYHQDVHFALKA